MTYYPPRTRQRLVTRSYAAYKDNSITDGPYFWPTTCEEIADFPGPRQASKPCFHVKGLENGPLQVRCVQSNGTSFVQHLSGIRGYAFNYAKVYGIWGFDPNKIWDQLSRLNWDKLPTSTQTGVLSILAELDDTLAMFAMKFWRSLSYGSLTWGVLPFVSDVKAILKAIINLGKKLSNLAYEDQYRVSVDYTLGYEFGFRADVQVRHSGSVTYNFANDALVLLDRLGFHTDLAALWDLIPFSFVIDYVLPIGDFLDSLKGGGWVKCVSFSGWRTIKMNAEYRLRSYSPASELFIAPYRVYSRALHTTLLTVDSSIDWPWPELPSFREIFNMFYLLFSQR